jgi:hypothetical protein
LKGKRKFFRRDFFEALLLGGTKVHYLPKIESVKETNIASENTIERLTEDAGSPKKGDINVLYTEL